MEILGDRLCCSQSVRRELLHKTSDSSRRWACASQLLRLPQFAAPVHAADTARVEQIRRALGGTDDRIWDHRGEAETIVAADELGGMTLMNDGDGVAKAAAEGIDAFNCWEAVDQFQQAGLLTEQGAAEFKRWLSDSR